MNCFFSFIYDMFSPQLSMIWVSFWTTFSLEVYFLFFPFITWKRKISREEKEGRREREREREHGGKRPGHKPLAQLGSSIFWNLKKKKKKKIISNNKEFSLPLKKCKNAWVFRWSFFRGALKDDRCRKEVAEEESLCSSH